MKKLRDIVKEIEDKIHSWEKPNLYEFGRKLWPKWAIGRYDESEFGHILHVVNDYIDMHLLSRNEGAFWLKSVDFEMQELRARIEKLEKENKSPKEDKRSIVDRNIDYEERSKGWSGGGTKVGSFEEMLWR